MFYFQDVHTPKAESTLLDNKLKELSNFRVSFNDLFQITAIKTEKQDILRKLCI